MVCSFARSIRAFGVFTQVLKFVANARLRRFDRAKSRRLDHARTKSPFTEALEQEQLTLLNVAIGREGSNDGNLTFFINAADPELSSTDLVRCMGRRRMHRRSCTRVDVPFVTCRHLLEQSQATPLYVKVDIEGADANCLESVAEHVRRRGSTAAPQFLSAEELPLQSLRTLYAAGYTGVKCQDQQVWWRAGKALQNGMVSGPFGDEVVDKLTNTTAWRPLGPFIEEQAIAKRKSRWPSKHRVCPRADVHLRWGSANVVPAPAASGLVFLLPVGRRGPGRGRVR